MAHVFVETLESRQLFSVALHAPHTPEHTTDPAHPEIHDLTHQGLSFTGSSLNADGSLDANLAMLLTPTANGYVGIVTVTNAAGKTTGKVRVLFDATGAFTYDSHEHGQSFHVAGQLGADHQTVTGSWTRTTKDGATSGTISLTAAAQNPPPNQSSVTFAGISTDSSGQSSMVQVVVTPQGRGYRGEIRVTSSAGNTSVFIVSFDTKGRFSFDQRSGNERLHIEGQVSADGQTLTGQWKNVQSDKTRLSGTFSLTRQ